MLSLVVVVAYNLPTRAVRANEMLVCTENIRDFVNLVPKAVEIGR